MIELLFTYLPFILAALGGLFGWIYKNKAKVSDEIAKQSRKEAKIAKIEAIKYGRMSRSITHHYNVKDEDIEKEVKLAKTKRNYFSK